jgi:hypothetical protein
MMGANERAESGVGVSKVMSHKKQSKGLPIESKQKQCNRTEILKGGKKKQPNDQP